MKTDEQKKVLSEFTISHWATLKAILGCMWPWATDWTPLREMLLSQIYLLLMKLCDHFLGLVEL